MSATQTVSKSDAGGLPGGQPTTLPTSSGSALNAATASVRTYIAPDPATGRAVLFAQRYAADGAEVGQAVAVTSGDVAPGAVIGVILLANNGFAVDYSYSDLLGQASEGLAHVTGAGAVLPVMSIPYAGQSNYVLHALDNGALAYLFYQSVGVGVGVPTVTVSLGFSGVAGGGFTIPLATESVGGPFPGMVFGDVSLQQLPGDKFSVSYSQSFAAPTFAIPGLPAGPSGKELFTKVYSDAGILLSSAYTGFDNSKTITNLDGAGHLVETETYNAAGQLVSVAGFDPSGRLTASTTRSYDAGGALSTRSAATFDPATGKLLQSATVEADGSRTDVNYAVTGKPYATQFASYDAAGRLTSLFRNFGDANNTLAFSQVNHADGSSDVRSYDTAGRETTHIATAADGSKQVLNSTYTGAATGPSTTADYHYGTAGQLLSVDTTGANGSHAQVAKAFGVTLVSTFMAADSFTGAGGDTFVFTPGSGQDLVTNFHAGAGAGHDVLDVSGFALVGQPGQSGFDVLARSLKQVGRDAVLTLTPGDVVTLKNTAVASLTKADFRVA